MNDDETSLADDLGKLEITLPTALELCRLGLATMIDIRQSFEIEMKGAIPDTVHIPMFEVKRMLGHALTDNEQEVLDAGQPKEIDAKTFFTMINRLHHAHDHVLLCICNSGRRSVTAASLLRSLGYPRRCRWPGASRPGKSCRQRLQAAKPKNKPGACHVEAFEKTLQETKPFGLRMLGHFDKLGANGFLRERLPGHGDGMHLQMLSRFVPRAKPCT